MYPDTYNVDAGKNIVDQLVYLQLENFKAKVRDQEQNIDMNTRYQKVILASILEKEERNVTNKPVVAGIFLKRLSQGIRLGADITLCYGLKQPYETCTPAVIARNITDKANIYNTRENGGLTPQPISNPTKGSIDAVLHPQTSEYLYYLHDGDGIIHYARTLDEHNANRQMYLK